MKEEYGSDLLVLMEINEDLHALVRVSDQEPELHIYLVQEADDDSYD